MIKLAIRKILNNQPNYLMPVRIQKLHPQHNELCLVQKPFNSNLNPSLSPVKTKIQSTHPYFNSHIQSFYYNNFTNYTLKHSQTQQPLKPGYQQYAHSNTHYLSSCNDYQTRLSNIVRYIQRLHKRIICVHTHLHNAPSLTLFDRQLQC